MSSHTHIGRTTATPILAEEEGRYNVCVTGHFKHRPDSFADLWFSAFGHTLVSVSGAYRPENISYSAHQLFGTMHVTPIYM
jgi:hypothetical protein